MTTWQSHFTERDLKEIEFCKVYQARFSHGTDGHNIRLIVAKLVNILEEGGQPEITLPDPAIAHISDKSTCASCGKPITFTGRYWEHDGESDLRHMAMPTLTMDKREALAAYAHEAWSGWMKYMFGKSSQTQTGEVTIPAPLVTRWIRQLTTEYAALPESEKASDRAEADKMLAIIKA